MTTEPKPDSVQNDPESIPDAATAQPGEQLPRPEAEPPTETASSPKATEPAASPKAPQPAPSSPAPAAPADAPSTEVSPIAPPPPKPATAAEIAASFVNAEDRLLDQSVEEAMAGISVEDLAGGSAEPPKSDEPAADSILTGRIANIGSDDVLIDFGGKDLGTMPLGEFGKDESYSLGDNIEVLVLGKDPRGGLLKVSRRKAKQAVLLRDMKVGRVVEANVTGMNKGGLEVSIEGLRGFIPASQVELRFVKDISNLIGQTITAEVTRFELDDDTPNLVLSRRRVLQREEAERRVKILEELQTGDVRRGRVRGITDFGAFVDLGGVDGLLHIRDMSWGRVNKAEDMVKIGEEIDVKIIKISQDRKRISLSLKQTVPNPWLNAGEKYIEGMTLQGRVVRLADFGAFVELEPGVDGLLPVSEMSWTRRVRHPSEIVKEGDVIEISILTVDTEKQRLSLSLKALGEDPWTAAAEKYIVGSTITGKVVRTTDFGAFIQLEDGIDGLVHISELSDTHVKAVTDKVSVGAEVDIRVLGVDTEAKRISLSMKPPPREPTPEEIAAIEKERAAAAKKRAARTHRRGGLTFGWDEGLGSLDPSKFAR